MKEVSVYVYVLWTVERSFERCSSGYYNSASLLRRTTGPTAAAARCSRAHTQAVPDAIMPDLSAQQVMRTTTFNATVKHVGP
eukprot:6892-Heterococcus_DN1.PRE.8